MVADPKVRKIARELVELRRRVATVENAPRLAYSSLEVPVDDGEAGEHPAAETVTVPQVVVNAREAKAAAAAAQQALADALEQLDVDLDRLAAMLRTAEVAPVVEDGEGAPVGAWWTQVDQAGAVVGRWRWDGTAWLPMPLSPVALPELWASKLVVDQAGFNTAVVNQLWVDLFMANKITAAEIEAGAVEAQHLNVVDYDAMAGNLLTLQPDGLRIYGPQDLDANGAPIGLPSISLTSDDAQSLTILGPDDVKVAGIDGLGNVTGLTGAFEESLQYRGTELSDLFAERPYGTIAKTTLSGDVIVSGTAGRILASNFQIPGNGDRQIRIIMSFTVNHGGGSLLPVAFDLKFNFFNTVGSGNTTVKSFWTQTDAAHQQTFTAIYEFRTTELGATGFLSAGVWARTSAGNNVRIISSSTNLGLAAETALIVEDVGPGVPTGRQEGVSTMQNATPDTSGSVGKRTVTETWYANGMRSFKNSGSTPITSSTELGFDKPIQGYTPYSPSAGVKGCHLYFDDANIRSVLSGATVDKVELYLYAEHWHSSSGGRANIATHGYSTTQATFGNSAHVGEAAFARGQGRWLGLPTSGWATGSRRGVSLAPPSWSSSSIYYGYFSGLGSGTRRPRLRITYTK